MNKRPHPPTDPLAEYASIISGLVHDLRTPLTSIIGAASSLSAYADRFDAETRGRLLDSIMEEADQLDRLLSNLSIVAKARSGTLAPECRPIRLQDLLLGAAEKVRQRETRIELRLAEDLPEVTLSAEPGMCQGVFLNVHEVVCRFVDRAGEAILSARAENESLQIGWSLPVAPARQQKLQDLLIAFAEDRRVEGVRASDLISLEAAREVVHSHRGRLTIESKEEKVNIVIALAINS